MLNVDYCNYCRIAMAKKEAKKKGWILTRLRAVKGPEGVTTYLHPKTVNIKRTKGLKRSPYYVVFYSEDSKSCHCV